MKYPKIIHVTIFLAIIAYSCSTSVTREITYRRTSDHIKYLSSDSLKGRMTGSPGDSLAALYIKDQLASYRTCSNFR